MKKMLTQLLLIIALVAAPLALTGCNISRGADSAESSDSESTEDEAKPAKNASEETDEDDGKDKRRRRRGKKDKEEEKKEEAVPVEVAALATGPIESVLRFSSNLEAESQVQVMSEAARRVTELLVEEGDRVRKGQLLLRLQDDEQRSALARTQSQYDKAEREYNRQKRLYDQQLVSEEEFNNATYEIDQQKIALDDAKRELSYTEVRAPIGGTITSRQINLGDNVTMGQYLFDIVDFESMVALVYVPEKSLPTLRNGLKARLLPQSGLSSEYIGKIKRISPIVDPRSGTVKVTVDVGAQRGLRPGMYVDVDLVTATEQDALLIPKRALVYDNDQMFVFRLGNGEEGRRVERLLVLPALSDKDNVLPSEGFQPGDQIVIAGQVGLKDGALVSLPGDEEEKEESDKGADAEMRADGSDSETVIAEAK